MTRQSETLLVLTPLPVEFKAIAKTFREFALTGEPSRVGSLDVLKYEHLVLAVGGHGKTQFAVQTQHLIHHLPGLRAIICAGCAGALVGDVALNDVVVAEQTLEHDFRLRFVQRPAPLFKGDAKLLEHLRAYQSKDFGLRFGIVASGDEDIVDAQRGEDLRRETGALAVAWEGAGGARACAFSGVPYLEVRGITDTADHRAMADFKSNLESAMRNVARTILALT